MKVSKEEIVGMVVAVETFVNKRDIQAEFREWESWYAHISERITQVPGVKDKGARSASGEAHSRP